MKTEQDAKSKVHLRLLGRSIGLPSEAREVIEIVWKAAAEFFQAQQPMPAWMQYDPATDVLTIHGKKYAAALFGRDGFLGDPGDLLRIEKGNDDVVTVTRIPVDQQAEPVSDDDSMWCNYIAWMICAYLNDDSKQKAIAGIIERRLWNFPRESQPVQPVERVTCSFPERDKTKPAEAQGLFRKFDVRRVDGSHAPGGKHHGCEYFVLDIDHDTHAPAAMRAYAEACKDSHPQLSAELTARFGTRPVQPAAGVNQQLFSALQLFIDTVEEPPEANCSCHIAPPCGDCVNYSQLREAFEDGRAAIAAAEAAKGVV